MDRRLFVRGLLIISMVGMLFGYVFAADQPGQQTQDQPAQRERTQQEQQQQRQMGLETTGQKMTLQRANELIGNDVRNRQGQNLGNVHDIVLTSDLQQVSYVALARGGVWGVGAELFAIPWKAVEIGPEDTLTVQISEQQLEAATGFDEDNWPAQGDSQWAAGMGTGRTTEPSLRDRIERQARTGQTTETEKERTDQQTRTQQYTTDRTKDRPTTTMPGYTTDRTRDRQTATTPGYTMDREMTMESMDIQHRRVTNLTGLNVKNDEGEDIANIEDLVIDVSEGRVAYTIVSFGGFWGIGERYAAVPHSVIELQPRRDVAILDADRETLESIAFEPAKFPDLADRGYAQRVHEAFDAEPYWVVFGYVPAEQQREASRKAWAAESQYAKYFDAENVKTIKGTVQSIGTFQPDANAPGVSRGLRLRVQTEEQQMITVFAGPLSHARQQNFYILPGDQITITGSEAKIGWRSAFVASEIKKGDQTLQLRDKTGRPLWQMAGEARPGQMDQPRPGQPGQRQPGQTGQPRPGQTEQRPGQTPQ